MRLAGSAAVLAVVIGTGRPVPASAQASPGIGLGLGLVPTWEETVRSGSALFRTGLMVEGALELAVSRFELEVVYREGDLSGGSDGGDARNLVEGQAMLAVRLAPWLKGAFGPRLRAYTTAAGTERWILWEGRIQAAARVIPPGGWAYLRVGVAAGGDTPGLTLDHGQGAEAGLELRPERFPLGARLGYWIHTTSTGGGQRVETVQGIALSFRVIP